MKKYIYSAFLMLLLCMNVYANPLPTDEAFQLHAAYNSNHMLTLDWRIAEGYYLYQDSIHLNSTNNSEEFGKYFLPDTADFKGRAAYQHHLSLQIPVLNTQVPTLTFNITYQGCSSQNYCYAPVTKIIKIDLTQQSSSISDVTHTDESSSASLISNILKHGILYTLCACLVFGILLTFTPCVLPMIPILSGIIVGQGKNITTARAFLLSLTYVIAMALTYAVAGLVIAWAGHSIQETLQSPFILSLFSLVFVLLALSLFGFYTLKLPQAFENKIARLSHHQKGGTYIGTFIMGVLSTLIVSPCVSAPLVAVLLYIAQTNDRVLGAASLFALGLGMGLPLLIVGTSAGKLLPKTGQWMNTVKSIFGVLLIAMAILMISRVLPPFISFLLWAVLCIVCAIYMGALSAARTGWQRLWKALGIILLVYGIALMIGALQGHESFTRPLSGTSANTQASSPFTTVRTMDQLNAALLFAKQHQQPVLLDFSASWCETCQWMEHTTYNNTDVLNALKSYALIRVDVTANDAQSLALKQRFDVIGTPTTLFLDNQGHLISQLTAVGGLSADALLRLLSSSDLK